MKILQNKIDSESLKSSQENIYDGVYEFILGKGYTYSVQAAILP